MTGDKVVIAWGSRKRHIFIDGEILCKVKHKPGYSKGGHYNSYDLDPGVFDRKFKGDLDQYTHTDGIIEFKSLEIQGIMRESICKKCQKKYDKLLQEKNK
jgi:hypothetical protein